MIKFSEFIEAIATKSNITEPPTSYNDYDGDRDDDSESAFIKWINSDKGSVQKICEIISQHNKPPKNLHVSVDAWTIPGQAKFAFGRKSGKVIAYADWQLQNFEFKDEVEEICSRSFSWMAIIKKAPSQVFINNNSWRLFLFFIIKRCKQQPLLDLLSIINNDVKITYKIKNYIAKELTSRYKTPIEPNRIDIKAHVKDPQSWIAFWGGAETFGSGSAAPSAPYIKIQPFLVFHYTDKWWS